MNEIFVSIVSSFAVATSVLFAVFVKELAKEELLNFKKPSTHLFRYRYLISILVGFFSGSALILPLKELVFIVFLVSFFLFSIAYSSKELKKSVTDSLVQFAVIFAMSAGISLLFAIIT